LSRERRDNFGKKVRKKVLATYYIRLPTSVIDDFEELRAEKGWEKSYMVTNAFREFIESERKKMQQQTSHDNTETA